MRHLLDTKTLSRDDALLLLEAAEAAARDGGVVNEHVLALVIGSNEAEALLAVEPFDGALSHAISLPVLLSRQFDDPTSSVSHIGACPRSDVHKDTNPSERMTFRGVNRHITPRPRVR